MKAPIESAPHAWRGNRLTPSYMLTLFLHAVATTAPPCSSTCVHRDCDNFNIKYGAYCGVGHTGCPGVAPCDAYDACCATHDSCVDKTSVTDARCHQALASCLDAALNNKTRTWIEERETAHSPDATHCTAKGIVQTMSQGMGLASIFSLFAAGAANAHAQGATGSTGHAAVQFGKPMTSHNHASTSFDEMRARHERIKRDFDEMKARHEKLSREMDAARQRSFSQHPGRSRRRILAQQWRGRGQASSSPEADQPQAIEARVASAPQADNVELRARLLSQ